jgi:hypothetical protein
MGPKEPRSTVLTKEEEALIVAFSKRRLKWGGSAALGRPEPALPKAAYPRRGKFRRRSFGGFQGGRSDPGS